MQEKQREEVALFRFGVIGFLKESNAIFLPYLAGERFKPDV
jgi:hypothetical protein